MVSRGKIRPIDVQVSIRIRTARLAHGVSQQKLAEALGVTFQQVQKYEKGTNRVTVGKLHAIANALGVPMSYFFDNFDIDPSTNLPETTVQSINAALKTKEGIRVAAALSRVRSVEIRRHIAYLLEAIIDGEDEERQHAN
jgi:transcriptional regulator with XRE-family HTH domain